MLHDLMNGLARPEPIRHRIEVGLEDGSRMFFIAACTTLLGDRDCEPHVRSVFCRLRRSVTCPPQLLEHVIRLFVTSRVQLPLLVPRYFIGPDSLCAGVLEGPPCARLLGLSLH
jgi:hypothetical protein